MEHVQTCCLCEAMCGLKITHDGAKVERIEGYDADVLSAGYLCPKATALDDLHTDPDRLRKPVRREGGRWVEVGWEAALDEAAERLHRVRTEHGRHSVALYLGNPTVHHYGTSLAAVLLGKALRTHNRFSATSLDQLPHMLAAYLMFGHQLLLPIPDIDRTELFVILGGNPVVSNGSIMSAPDMRGRLKALRKRGGRVVVIDPRKTRTAELADTWLPIRPGTDALLLLAMLHVIFAEERVAQGPWRSWTDGLDVVRLVVQPYTPERVADTVGIDAEAIRDLAREIATARRAAVYGRVGMCTQRFGGLAAWLTYVLNIVTGRLDVPGGVMFTKPAVDLLGLTSAIGLKGHFDAWRSRVRGLPEFGGELPTSVLAEEIETPGEGQIRALVTIAGNPVLSAPDGERLARALEGLDTQIAIDPYITATSRHADLILPPVSPLERDHFDIVFHALAVRNTVKYSDPLFAPDPNARGDAQIVLGLAARLRALQNGGAGSFRGRWAALAPTLLERYGMAPVLDLMLRVGPYGAWRPGAEHKLTLDALRARPEGIDLGALRPCLPERLQHDDKRLQLAPLKLVEDLPRLERDLDAGVLVPQDARLLLIGRRDLRSNNSWMHNSARLVRGKRRCTLQMHPDDASARGLNDGQDVSIRSRVGQVTAPLELSDRLRPGVVCLPHGWGHAIKGAEMQVANATDGVSSNDLTDPLYLDALSGNAGLNGVFVEVEASL